ncbi:MAG: SusD/RagB family nutrient-binding outer membrane lipoprotein [Bacteroidales bacterium]|nr:SusD/RagB family nutrient-binding outer membrane lipoprotein [Bacteroidales bacterium]
MKALRKYSLIVTAFGLLFFVGCENDFDEINHNNNASTEASTPALLSQAIRNIAFYDFDEWYAGRQSSIACQHFSQRNYTSEDRYSFRVNTTDGFFRNNYIFMNNLQKIIELNTDPATKDKYATLYGDNNMQIAIAEIMKCWVFQLLTDYFGDIPYSQALNLDEYSQPIYNTQKEVYDGLIATLKKAVVDLKASTTDGFSEGDLFYNGDLSKWIKFANSLRLRLALRASNVDANYLSEAQDAITGVVMSSNADDAMCGFSTVGEPNEAPWYSAYYVDNRNDFSYTYRFLELLKGTNGDIYNGITSTTNVSPFVNPYSGIVDPRFEVYTTYSPVVDPDNPARYGVPYGMGDSDTKTFWSVFASNRVSLYSVQPVILNPNFPTTFLDYPTVCFMISEVNNWDASWFQKGIEASLEKWGADPGTYVTDVMTRFNSLTTDEARKEMVITQKYIHLLMQPHEAWAEYRRTGYPSFLVKPGELTWTYKDSKDRVFTYNFSPVSGSESGSDLVARFKYPSSEYTLNKSNVEAAVARMGEDTHKQKVWWAGGGSQ